MPRWQPRAQRNARNTRLPRGRSMDRRVFVIEAGKAFPVIAGALYLIGCGGSSTSPSGVADVHSTSTVVNSHTHTANAPASDQLHPADTAYTSSNDGAHNHMVTLTSSQ